MEAQISYTARLKKPSFEEKNSVSHYVGAEARSVWIIRNLLKGVEMAGGA